MTEAELAATEEERNRALDAEIVAAEGGVAAMNGQALGFRPASEIIVEPVRWAWDQRIPLGHMTVLGGRPGLGKTTLAVELAAQATRGTLDGDLDGPVSVLYVTA